MEPTSYAPGSLCWFELHTNDAAAAKQFYGGLFGWQPQDIPIGPDQVYTMLLKNGKQVGAAYEDHQSGIPPHWNTYVSVTSADETAAKAKELGGSVMMEPFDVMDVGRMAVLQDPTGAAICVWQAKSHQGAQVVDEPNAFCWSELSTRDLAKAADFYSKLGWGIKGDPADPNAYLECQVDGKSVAGMMTMPEHVAAMGVPSHWLPYVAVTDCDGIASKAKATGATLHVEPRDIEGVGRFAVFQDPQGAAFAVVQLK